MRELLCILIVVVYVSVSIASPQWNIDFSKFNKDKKKEKKIVPDNPKSKAPEVGDGKKKGGKVYKANTNPNYIPPETLRKLQRVNSVEDFIKLFKPVGDYSKTVKLLGTKRVPTREGVAMDVTGANGGCTPRDVIMPLTQPADMSGFYWPSCVSVKQCGGCCPNEQFMQCVPTQMKKVAHNAFFIPSAHHISPSARAVDMLHHTQCSCQCRVKASDCNSQQTYDAANCQCYCAKTPTTCPYGKSWSPRACGCVCSQRFECASGRIWNENTCKCTCPTTKCPSGAMHDPSTCLCVNLANGYPVHDNYHRASYDRRAADAGGVGDSNNIDLSIYEEL